MVSVPSFVIASRLLAPIGVASLRGARRGAGRRPESCPDVGVEWYTFRVSAWRITWRGGAMGKLTERMRFSPLVTLRNGGQRTGGRLEEFLLQPEIDQRFSANAALMRLFFNGR